MSSMPLRQPRHALTPSAFSVEAAEQQTIERALMLPADHFRLRFRDWNGRNYSVTTLTRSNKVGATTRYSAGKKTEGSS
jgi:hypothetical protein